MNVIELRDELLHAFHILELIRQQWEIFEKRLPDKSPNVLKMTNAVPCTKEYKIHLKFSARWCAMHEICILLTIRYEFIIQFN